MNHGSPGRMNAGAAPDEPAVRERTRRIDALVLAAGSSTRFGGQKLVADVGGVPLIRRTVEGVLDTSVSEVHVVTGADEEEVRSALRGLRVAFTRNPDHAEGMGTSIAAGVRALPSECAAVVVALGDQPTASPVIDLVIDEFVASRAAIVVPEFEGVRSPPVLFGRECFGALKSLGGDAGARAFIAANPALVRVLAIGGRAPPDIDTRSDAAAFEAGRDGDPIG